MFLPSGVDIHPEVSPGDASRYVGQVVALAPVLDVVAGLL